MPRAASKKAPCLQNLSAELRNKIYKLALIEESPRGDLAQPALCRVNQQVRRDALAIFYSENIFRIDRLPKMLRLHAQIRAAGLRKVGGIHLAHILCSRVDQARALLDSLSQMNLQWAAQEIKVQLRVSSCGFTAVTPWWKNVFTEEEELDVQYEDCQCGTHVRDLGDLEGYVEFRSLQAPEDLLVASLESIRVENGRVIGVLPRVENGNNPQQGCCVQ